MDAERLAAYLRTRLPHAGELRVQNLARIGGGASRETWSADVSATEGGREITRGLVVRRDPPAGLLDSDRRHEFRVMRAARELGIPVPEVYWVEDDPRWLDRPFVVMERLEGAVPPVVFAAGEPVELRRLVAGEFVRHLATIHAADWRRLDLELAAVPATAEDAARAQVAHWQGEYRRAKTEERPVLARALAWLGQSIPRGGNLALVHGDYRAGNIIYRATGIAGILDWEMAHVGDPLEDLAWAVLQFWRGGDLCQGLLSRAEMIAAYEKARGDSVDPARLFFYEVLGHVKMAVIALTGVRSFVEERVADGVLALVGYMVPRLEGALLSQLRGVPPWRGGLAT
jgi:aminoglycoside phosphotransferase (APT) family kinase protein